MANRPVFVPDDQKYVSVVDTEFEFCPGFAAIQKKRSVANLHRAFLGRFPDARILEISSFSETEAGIALSAFNLTYTCRDGNSYTVEKVYHAGKVFEHGGPFTDLLQAAPGQAKRDPRLKENGRIIRFELEGRSFPTEPQSLYYTWLYINALCQNPELAEELMKYTAFTDIVFNPQKSVSCQASAAAVYVSLRKKGELDKAVQDPSFLADVLSKKRSRSAYSSTSAVHSSAQHSASAVHSSAQRSASAVHSSAQRSASAVHSSAQCSSSAIHGSALSPGTVSPGTGKAEPVPFTSAFRPGDVIRHPRYGAGTVRKVAPDRNSAVLTIYFEQAGEEKRLDENWVRRNCSNT